MIGLIKSSSLQRKIRRDSISELGKPALLLAAETMRTCRYNEANELMNYANDEAKLMHDLIVKSLEDRFTYIANELGEEAVEKVTRKSFYPITKRGVKANLNVEETLARTVGNDFGKTT